MNPVSTPTTPRRSWLSVTGKVVGALATLVALVGGVVAIYDRFADHGPDLLRLEIKGQPDVVRFTDFLQSHASQRVELHVTCADPVGSPCGLAGVDLQPTSKDTELALLFREEMCVNEYGQGGECPGTWWLYVATEESPDALTAPGGAGSFSLDGVFDVRVRVNGFIVPPAATGASIRAVRS